MVLLQVPHMPRVQEDGRRSPAAFAAARIVMSGPHWMTRPLSVEFDAETVGCGGDFRLYDCVGFGWGQFGEVETLLVIAGHVEARFAQHGANTGHERGRAAAEDFALQRIGGDQAQHRQRQAAREGRPVAFTGGGFADMGQTQSRRLSRHHIQLVPEDDIRGAARRMDEDDVALLGQIERSAGHRHERGDAAAAGQHQPFLRACRRGREVAHRPERANFVAGLEIVVQPVRHHAAGLPLDRDRNPVGPRRRGRDRIAAVDDFPANGQLERQELAGQKAEQARFAP